MRWADLKDSRPVALRGSSSMHRSTLQSPLSTLSWPHHTLVRKAYGQRGQLQGTGHTTPRPRALRPPEGVTPHAQAHCSLGGGRDRLQAGRLHCPKRKGQRRRAQTQTSSPRALLPAITCWPL